MLQSLLSLLVVGWLPGAAMFRMPWLDRERRERLDAEERVFWSVVLSIATSLAIVLALAAAHRYSFRRLIVADLIVTLGVIGLSRGRLLFESARRPTPTLVVPLLLAALATWRFFPPSEYVIGGKDPGGYVNEGIHIAQRGALVVNDPVVASIPPFARDLFHPSHERLDYDSVRFMGFFIKNPDSGATVSQFPHLFPASVAIGYGLDGLTGARRAVTVWAVLGVLAVYFFGVRLFGRTAAAAAAGLLALNVVTVWFARYPNAEVVMQTVLFATLLALARAHVDEDRFFAPVAGLLTGLLLFLRFDAVLVVAGVLAGLAAAAVTGVRMRASFALALLGSAAVAAVYYLGPMRAYVDLPIVFLSNLPRWQYVALALLGTAGVWALATGARRPGITRAVQLWLPLACAGAMVAGAVYALFFRHPAGKLAIHDAYALRTFASFYAMAPAVLAAVAGYAITARRRFWNDPAFYLTVLIFSFFLFYKIRIVPDHFWLARRFVPVILPATLLLTASLALEGSGAGRRRLLRLALGGVFLALLASSYVRASRPVVAHVEYAGLIPKLEELARTVGPDLLIVESRNASDTHVLALPLSYIYARDVLVLHSPTPDKPTFAAFLEWAGTKYPRVLFMGGGGTALLSRRWGVEAVASERFQVPEYDAPLNAYPRYVRRKEFDYSIYAFTPAPPGADPWFDLDVGVRDDLHVLRFHAKERAGGRTFRWTMAASYVTLTSLHPTSRTLTIWMDDGGRPAAAPPAEVSVYLAQRLLGTVQVTGGWRAYELAIPPDVAEAASRDDTAQIRLITPLWNPARVLGTGDDRDLGVMVDRVTVK